MKSRNRIEICGHVGRDAETRVTQSGMSVTSFSVATNRPGKKRPDGSWEDRPPDWHDIVIFQANEEIVDQITKGTPVSIVGRVQYDKWEKDGQQKNRTSIIANDGDILIGVRSNNGASRPAQAQQSSQHLRDDDVPF
jgi:single-strand DNA-binding protein